MKKKNKLKPFISLMLAFLLVFGLTPAPLFTATEAHALETATGPLSGTCGNNLNWTLTEIDPPPAGWDLTNKGVPYKLTLSGSGSMGDFSSSSQPWNGHAPWICSVELSSGITDVGSYAFYNCVSLTSITLPNSVTAIGDRAFYNCYLLKTVSCGTGLTSIGSYAFAQTNELSSIQLSNSKLAAIGSYAFSGSSLTTIALPSSLTTIGSYAFASSALSTVTFSGVTRIETSAFRSCYSLRNISSLEKVTYIGNSAFYYCYNLTGVTLGGGLAEIGDSAFYSSGLTSLNIPATVASSIGSFAFYDCDSLNSVTFGSGIKTVGPSAFNNCSSLMTINFGSVETIQSQAFASCGKLTSVSLPASLKTIEAQAFASTGLSSFAVPQNVASIGYGILSSCQSLNQITVTGNSKFQILNDALCDVSGNEANRVIAYPAAKTADSYTVPDTMQIIDQYAFYGSNIKNLTLPDSIETLRSNSFASSSLTSVSIGKNTSSISVGSSGAFNNSGNLETITTPAEDSKLKAVDNVLYTQDLATLYFYPFAKKDTVFQVPDAVTAFNAYAIYRVPALKELYLPQNLATLPNYAVNNNSKLHSIYFSGNAVGSSSSVSSYNAPDLLLYRLEGSEGWDENNWDKMTYAVWDPEDSGEDGGTTDTLVWKYEAFNRRLTLTGASAISDYTDTALPPWHSYTDQIQTIETAGDAVTKIGDYSFYGASNLLRLSTDNQPAEIGRAAFKNCQKLKFVSFNAVATIGEEAFSGDTALTGTWNNSNLYYIWNLSKVASIGARAFKDCSAIPKMNLRGSGLTELPDEAFAGCSGLTQLTLPDHLASIGSYAFRDCAALATNCPASISAKPTVLTVPNSVAEVGSGAFKGCTALKSLDLPNNITALADETLEGCSSLTSLLLPSNLASIGANALKGCTSLVGIDIPESVTSIGSNAFSGTIMEGVYFKGALPDISNDAFSGCDGKTTILYYLSAKDEGERWAALGTYWQSLLPIKALDHFYTAGQDHYSFTNSRESFGYDSGYRVPRQRYVDVLDSIIKGTYYYSINKRWAGSCYGMASTTLEFYENINNNIAFDLKNYASSSVKSVYDIEAPTSFGNDLGGNLKKLIEAYQISQYQPQISACGGQIAKNMNNFTGLRDKITKFASTGGLNIDANATPIVIAVYSLFGGHALVPISWEQADDGNFEIEVYDCNYPDETRIMTINREMNEFSYGFYNLAFSFVDYTAIAEGMSNVVLYSSPVDDSLYLSIDKADGKIADASGNGLDKIKGAYEQKPFTATEGEEDSFGGVKSYVLPSGNYTLASESSNETENTEDAADQDVTFFMASEDVFAEVSASDEDTALSVGTAGADEKVAMTLSAGEQAGEDENISITLINESGMERAVDIENYNGEDIQLAVSETDTISVTAPAAATIKVDGETASTENGKLSLSFESGEKESPFKIRELETEASCNDKNRLNASWNAAVVYQKFKSVNATLITEYYDKDNNLIASYTEKKELNPGLNYIESFRENLRTSFPQAEGEVPIYCRLTISDQEQFSASAQSNEVTVTVTKQDPSEEDPDEPEPIDPVDPVDPPTDPDDGNKDDDNKDDGNTDDDNKDDGNTDDDNKDDDNKDDDNKDDSSGGPSNITGGSTEEQDPPADKKDDQNVPVTAISVTPKKITIGIGESFQIKTAVMPTNATDKTVTYKASNKKVSIKANGKITGKKAGTAWITVSSASNPKATGRIQVTVKKAPKKITLNAKSKTLKKGRSFKIKVKLKPTTAASNKITFSSNKPSVAKVTASGKVIALKKGAATITVKTFNRKKAKLKIRVN